MNFEIKEYRAETYKEALRKATVDYQKNFRILANKWVKKKGLKALFAKNKHECLLKIIPEDEALNSISAAAQKPRPKQKPERPELSARELGDSVATLAKCVRRFNMDGSPAEPKDLLDFIEDGEEEVPKARKRRTFDKKENSQAGDEQLEKIAALENKLNTLFELIQDKNKSENKKISAEQEDYNRMKAASYKADMNEKKEEDNSRDDECIISDEYFMPNYSAGSAPVMSDSVKPRAKESRKDEPSGYSPKRSLKQEKGGGQSAPQLPGFYEDERSAEDAGESDKTEQFMNKPTVKSESAKTAEKNVRRHMNILRRMDFPEETVEMLEDYLDNEVISSDLEDDDKLKNIIQEHLTGKLNFSDGLSLKEGKKKVVFLVGPTGVGKTTTIPKISFDMKASERSTSLISLDCYRIGAHEQLKRYAELLNTPFETPDSVENFRMKILSETKESLIFVDTAGRSPKDIDAIMDMKDFIENTGQADVDVLLVISASAKYMDALKTIGSFKKLNYNGVVLTKLDETYCIGPALSALSKAGVPLKYVTDGQKVPRAIGRAIDKKDDIIKMIYGE